MITCYERGCLAASSKLLLVFFICLIMAQGQNTTPACHSMDIGDYAKLSYCISPEISVVPGTWTEGNYSQGEDVITSLLLGGGKVGLHLLYPCAIRENLTPSELRSEANAFDPEMAQASYNMTPVNISGTNALWGTLDNMTFSIYQPSNMTIAIIFFDNGTSYQIENDFLKSLKIEMGSKVPERYCAQSGSKPSPAQNEGRQDIFNSSTSNEFGPDMEAMITGHEISQDALNADRQAREEQYKAEFAQ